MRHLITLTLIAAALAVLGAGPPVAGAQSPLTASFTVAPASPARGETVTLTSTTTPAATTGRSYAWDLDDDGAFDDGTGATVTTSFATSGAHVVRLRAMQSGSSVQTSEAERTITVHDAPAPPPKTEPDGAAPEEQPPPHTQPVNKPPHASIDLGCHKTGAILRCPKQFARHGKPFTLSAATSKDPDGLPLAKFEWDTDADGTYELDTGTTPSFTRTYMQLIGGAPPKRKIGLRVTDAHGGTAATQATITILPPSCEDVVEDGKLVVKGVCLRPYKAGKLRYWRSTEPVTVNGILLQPGPGGVKVTLGDGRPRIEMLKGQVSASVKDAHVVLSSSKVDWRVHNERLLNFTLDGSADLHGLKPSLIGKPLLKPGGASKLTLQTRLPAKFGDTASDPIVVPLGGAQAANAKAFNFTVPEAMIGPIGLEKLVVKYDGEGLWEIKAGASLPAPLAASITGEAGVRHGEFEYGGGKLDLQSGGGKPVGAGVFLQEISFRVEFNPTKETSQCITKVGTETINVAKHLGTLLGADVTIPPSWKQTWDVDHGYPTFALCGGVKLTAGPSVEGHAAAELNAALAFAMYSDRPSVVRAVGGLKMIGIPLARAEFALYGDGYVNMFGDVHWDLADIFRLDGFVKFEAWKARFNAQAYVKACIKYIELCASANALVSSKGVAVCLSIGVLGLEWRPGVAVTWGPPPSVTPYFSGCEVGPYKDHLGHGQVTNPVSFAARRGEFAPRTVSVDLEKVLPGVVIGVEGKGEAPNVTLVGPNGERFKTPTGPNAQQPGVLTVKHGDLVQFVVAKPAKGEWTVQPEPGSAPITRVRSAEGLSDPKVSATVTGTGQDRALNFTIEERAGQVVRFVERGKSVGKDLGVARGAQGTLRFQPGAGKAERRDIVAIVEQDGMPRAELQVATYQAPDAPKAGRVTALKVKRVRGSLVATWRKSSGAAKHQVSIKLAGGRRIVRTTRRSRFVVPGVAKGVRGSIAVRGLQPAGRDGAATRLSFR